MSELGFDVKCPSVAAWNSFLTTYKSSPNFYLEKDPTRVECMAPPVENDAAAPPAASGDVAPPDNTDHGAVGEDYVS